MQSLCRAVRSLHLSEMRIHWWIWGKGETSSGFKDRRWATGAVMLERDAQGLP